MLAKVRNNFITGVAIIFPAAITVIIMRYLFILVNRSILNPLIGILKLSPISMELGIYIAKTLIFIIVVFLICVVGWAANIIFLRKLFGFGEKIFVKVPMIGKIYSVTKEIGSAFLGRGKAFFKRVVLIEYPRKGIYSIGFTTGEGTGEVRDAAGEEVVSIFLPTTPNPTSGIFLLVPKLEAKFLDMSVEEGLKIVVSSGSIMPPVGTR